MFDWIKVQSDYLKVRQTLSSKLMLAMNKNQVILMHKYKKQLKTLHSYGITKGYTCIGGTHESNHSESNEVQRNSKLVSISVAR